jgi:hypothetical protein
MGGVTLTGSSCAGDPILEARSAPSGTTAGFKRYLADLDSTEGNVGFTYGECTATAEKAESAECWPEASNKVETGNESGGLLAEKVYNTPGSAGYADLADARKHFKAAVGTFEEHENAKNEKYYSAILLVPNGTAASEGTHRESPEITTAGAEEGGSNCKSASYPEPAEVKPNEDWSKAKESNATSGTAGVYPICTLTFDVAWQRYKSPKWTNAKTSAAEEYAKEQYGTTFSYLRAVVTKGQEGEALKELAKKHFLGLPSKLVTEDKSGVTRKHIFWETENK